MLLLRIEIYARESNNNDFAQHFLLSDTHNYCSVPAKGLAIFIFQTNLTRWAVTFQMHPLVLNSPNVHICNLVSNYSYPFSVLRQLYFTATYPVLFLVFAPLSNFTF